MLMALPEYIHLTNAERAAEPWLDDALKLVSQRMFAGAPGTEATVTRLSEIVLIELLKSSVVESESATTIMNALRDSQIRMALETIHEQTDYPWTVASLAKHIRHVPKPVLRSV